MAIVKMNKFTLLAFESKRAELLGKLQGFSKVEFINLQDEEMLENNEELQSLYKDGSGSEYAECDEKLSKAKFALKFLGQYVPKKSGLKAMREGKLEFTLEELEEKVLNGNWEEVYDAVKEKEDRIAELESKKTKLQTVIDAMQPWQKLDASFEDLNALKAPHFFGSVPKQYEESLNTELDKCYLEIISQDNQDIYFLAICDADDKEEVAEKLRGFGFSQFKTEVTGVPINVIHDNMDKIEKLDSKKFFVREELASMEAGYKTLELATDYYSNIRVRKDAVQNFLKTENIMVVQGWVPTEKVDTLTEIVKNVAGEDYHITIEDVKEEEIDDVPIALQNNDLNAAFEDVTSMYALPKYNEIDPTPIVTPFYLLFFGMMVADMGYGILMLIGTLLALKFLHFDEGMKKMIKFFFYLSFPTIAFGAAYGSFFGDVLKVQFGINLPRILDTNTDVMSILALSVGFGALQIVFALCIKAYVLIKLGKPKDALMDSGSWLLMLFSLGALAAGMMLDIPVCATIGKYGAILGALAIVLTQGRSAGSTGGKIGSGLYELYGVTSYVGDLVSYTRLMAIGLSGGSIAGAVNLIMSMIGGPIGTFLIGPLIFVIFQTVNLGLSLLSGYVHTLRLTYVEYFGKFYEGGGKAFKPFETKNEYINITRE